MADSAFAADKGLSMLSLRSSGGCVASPPAIFAHLHGEGEKVQITAARQSQRASSRDMSTSATVTSSVTSEPQNAPWKASSRSSLHQMSSGYFGLRGQESCYPNSYLDLILNEGTRRVFIAHSRTVSYVCRFFGSLGFLQVETPRMGTIDCQSVRHAPQTTSNSICTFGAPPSCI
ncbi:uncharacterized protein PHACADRAFT_201833 [Phanerochaete carnosa HHB-10118-sp]|uniref:Aminoacyl-tRNA synthetase class II (D/K/N) domain-containing protein n=1 Tax=Phanerochaete carnosa (strain HHB-10118-sp) TaxID=650164 RepID=K5VRA8_PHACS|nr:uncharacterized protein PHACADRAFT_201833 [Phanerochaete carnosa HHB-10118-sp]EKM49270.1 hypothetical protein PHACADRAFT_201833 [Phanerochaete carnosa HHB-10118-sp]